MFILVYDSFFLRILLTLLRREVLQKLCPYVVAPVKFTAPKT